MDQDERQRVQKFVKLMEPLTRRYMTDGVVTDAFREVVRQRRDRFEKMDGLPAEQVKAKLEATLANGGAAFFGRFDPGNMSESDLREAMEKYGCTIEDLANIYDALREMLASRIDGLAVQIHEASPEDVKGKVVGMMAQMETF